jgi:hypothetical protein
MSCHGTGLAAFTLAKQKRRCKARVLSTVVFVLPLLFPDIFFHMFPSGSITSPHTRFL